MCCIPFLGGNAVFSQQYNRHPKHTCYRLFALGLELPEEALVNLHRFDAAGESSGIHKIITPISFIDELFRPFQSAS